MPGDGKNARGAYPGEMFKRECSWEWDPGQPNIIVILITTKTPKGIVFSFCSSWDGLPVVASI